MTAETISAVAGLILSLLFSYLPKLSDWYATLDGTQKRLVMLGLLALTAAGAYGLSCVGWGASFGITLTCDQAGLQTVIQAFIAALVANQATFLITTQKTAPVVEPPK